MGFHTWQVREVYEWDEVLIFNRCVRGEGCCPRYALWTFVHAEKR